MTEKTYKFGVVGAGMIAEFHALALAEIAFGDTAKDERRARLVDERDERVAEIEKIDAVVDARRDG